MKTQVLIKFLSHFERQTEGNKSLLSKMWRCADKKYFLPTGGSDLGEHTISSVPASAGNDRNTQPMTVSPKMIHAFINS